MDVARIGKAIKTLRLQVGYTQHDLAGCLGVTDKAVSKWERGLSVPDISIITKLSVLLNVDVDNLLEGNITYLEKAWQGLLILSDNEEVYSGSEVYGKPLVYFYLGYFMLAGIGNVYISCSERDKQFILKHIGDGSKFGIKISILSDNSRIPPTQENTMAVYNNPFIYGPNLTKYFQRAMSRLNGISILTINKKIGINETMVVFDRHKAIRLEENSPIRGVQHVCAPILFVPKKYFNQLEYIEDINKIIPLFAEPMGNGIIEYCVEDKDSLLETSSFLRYLWKQMGKDIYDLNMIARNRGFKTNV